MTDRKNHIKAMPPLEYLRQVVSYNSETGKFIWLPRPREHFKSMKGHATWNARFADTEAFISTSARGYLKASIDHSHYNASRIAWKLFYGCEPEGSIDHINGDVKDNRIVNLRDVSHRENMRNQKLRSNNTSGVIGVSRRGSGWRVRINGPDGKRISLGNFENLETALTARMQAEISHGYHPNHGAAR